MALRARLPYLVALLLSGLFLWQALELEEWGILGPGPGLFPRIVAGACVLLSALLACMPGLAGDAAQDGANEAGPAERRVLRFHVAALLLLPPACEFLGFIAASLLLALLLTWRAERRGLVAALAFGAACGLAGVVVFQQLLGAEIPSLALERAIARLFS